MEPPAVPEEAVAMPLLLAPGGDEECVRAALVAGADAIYLGLPRWNARMRATNIAESALPALTRMAHARGARIYLTLNTLLAEEEVPEALDAAERCAEQGVDAVIVQDWGLLAGLRDLADQGRFGAEIHASTQMTTHNAAQLEPLAALGVAQVILARELALDEIRALSSRARELHMRTEVFVHGAYCVSVSGQCAMSAVIAGRSGNRGECAQPCRRRYRDERGREGYPLSLKDCSHFASLGDLAAAGVSGLKIEGRMKGADYVATVVSAFRAELDRLARGEAGVGWVPALDRVFNRGFHDGFLRGKLERGMFGGEPFDASLSPLGEVRGYTADSRLLRLEEPRELTAGDLLSILTADRALLVCKARVLRPVTRDTVEVDIEGELKGRIVRGCLVYRHPALAEAAAIRAEAALVAAPAAVAAGRVEGRAGSPLRLELSAGGISATVESTAPLRPADRHGLDEERLRSALGRLGGTRYALGELDLAALEPGLFLPVSLLNDMRRRAVAILGGVRPARTASPRLEVSSPPLPRLPRLGVILSDPGQAGAFRERGALVLQEITDPRAPFDPAAAIPYFPAVVFDAELDGLRAVARRPGVRGAASDNVGLGLACAALGLPWIAGPHANVTNAAAVRALRAGAGAAAYFHSPESDAAQIRALGAVEGMQSLVVVAGPMLVMTIRQCIVRNVDGCPKAEMDARCVLECRRSAVMRDEGGRPFFVEKRPGGYTEIYNGSMLWYPRAVRTLSKSVDCFVLDLRDLSFCTLALPEKLDLLARCELALDGGEERQPGGPPYPSVTRGGFGRGL
jgi:U32 family peptidase